jgi:cell division septum initiation protein DivIVA
LFKENDDLKEQVQKKEDIIEALKAQLKEAENAKSKSSSSSSSATDEKVSKLQKELEKIKEESSKEIKVFICISFCDYGRNLKLENKLIKQN